MTSSRACLRSSLRVLVLLALAAFAQGAQAEQPVDLDRLLGAFAKMPGLEARFVEEKRIALLAQPLQSKGRLYFTKPGHLVRKVESPLASEVVITPDELRVKDQGREQAIDLRARADLRPFVESLVWILAGNREALSRVYVLSFEPAQGDKPWQLTLTPKGEPLSRLIQHIRIRGQGLAVAEVHVRETSGDETVTRILEANPARSFSDEERRRLFGSSGARGSGS